MEQRGPVSMRRQVQALLLFGLRALQRNGRRVAADRSGATVVEFAILGMPFFMALFAVFEVGFSYYLSAALDNAARIGERAVLTGAVSTTAMTASAFQTQVICPALPAVFTCSNVIVNLTIVPQNQSPTGYYTYLNGTSSGLDQPGLTDTPTFCPGAGNQYVVLQVQYPASFLTAFFSSRATVVYNGKKVNSLMATATFKNEPYAGAATYTGC